ncbi:MAG TPA: PEGA domain-containing protein [Vicinamibacterales bacterium]
MSKRRLSIILLAMAFATTGSAAAYASPAGQFGYPHPNMAAPDASLRLEVKPKQAEVYVDGYYAGVVDDFDGAFQRLRLPIGEHEVVIYLDGYRAIHKKLYLTPDVTIHIKEDMAKLEAGEEPEGRPQPVAPPPGSSNPPPPSQAPQRSGRGGGHRGGQSQPPPTTSSQPPQSGNQGQGAVPAGGRLELRVTPADADFLIDGESWHGPREQDRVMVDLPEGHHTIEIRKAGYRTFLTDIEIRRGMTTPVQVELRAQDTGGL